jgi:hypothetical protein
VVAGGRDGVSYAGLFAISKAEERAAMSDSKNNDGGPAFPVPQDSKADEMGMSLRDWFAGQALAGLIAQCNMPNEVYARMSCSIADAMLKARNAQ